MFKNMINVKSKLKLMAALDASGQNVQASALYKAFDDLGSDISHEKLTSQAMFKLFI